MKESVKLKFTSCENIRIISKSYYSKPLKSGLDEG